MSHAKMSRAKMTNVPNVAGEGKGARLGEGKGARLGEGKYKL